MELGAGIAYSGNRYIKGWAKEFGLVEVKPPKNKFGLWNGDNFVFKESSISALTAVKIVDRYGSDLLSLRTAVYEATSKFDKIYGLQEDGVCFDTAGDLWRHLGLHTYTQQSFKEAMASKLSPSSKLLSELMFAVNKVNYNQSNDVNALAGIVSMCPLVTGDVFSLTTGWTSILKEIFKGVDGLHVSTPVTKITSLQCSSPSTSMQRQCGPKYRVESEEASLGTFDAVVLTCPSVTSGLELILDFVTVTPKLQEKSGYCRSYKTTHTTFVKGKMNDDYFIKNNGGGVPQTWLASALGGVLGSYYDDPKDLPQSIYLVEEGAKKEKFSSYSKYFDFKDCPAGHSLYKVFSAEPLAVSTLHHLFTPDSSVMATREWNAYPQFSPPENTSASFRMGASSYGGDVASTNTDLVHEDKKRANGNPHRVYNTAILEGSVAAMEISAISGRNIALLLHRDFQNSA
mmetsp:Transcript_1783/g.3361  ORF Transcript_1783/g.3361 Transcript_1783/m.3361 type:complete len:458 (+) Transcript_1783:267-1640(+)